MRSNGTGTADIDALVERAKSVVPDSKQDGGMWAELQGSPRFTAVDYDRLIAVLPEGMARRQARFLKWGLAQQAPAKEKASAAA